MGPTIINGLPAHPLLVHFVVVFVPISALLLAVAVCWPAARTRLGVLTPIVAVLTLIMVPITTHAGSALQQSLGGGGPQVAHHAQLGNQMVYWSIGVAAAAILWWLMHLDAVAGRIPKALMIVFAIAALAVAAGSVVQIVQVGDSGSKAVWDR